MDNFVKLIAYIAPYFLIPLTFKFGLGVFGNLAGMVNDRSRGFFDKQRKGREASRAGARQRAREGKRFAGGTDNNWRGKYLNRGIANTLNAPGAILESGNTFKPGNWGSATRQRSSYLNAGAIERNIKENAAYQTWAHNDDLNRAASESSNAGQLRDNLVNNYGYTAGSRALEDDVARVETVRRSMGNDAFRQMTTLQAIEGGTAYESAGEISHAIARAAGTDDAAAAWLVAKGRSVSMNAGRVDYGGVGFGAAYGEVAQFRDMIADGSTQADIDAEIIQSTDRLTDNVYQSQGGATLVHSSMKPSAVEQMAPAVVRTVERSAARNDPIRFSQDLASVAATYDGLAASSPEKARIWADSVMSHPIDVSQLTPATYAKLGLTGAPQPGSTVTVREAIESLRGDDHFLEMRREFGNAVAAQQGMQPTTQGQPPNQQLPPPGKLS